MALPVATCSCRGTLQAVDIHTPEFCGRLEDLALEQETPAVPRAFREGSRSRSRSRSQSPSPRRPIEERFHESFQHVPEARRSSLAVSYLRAVLSGDPRDSPFAASLRGGAANDPNIAAGIMRFVRAVVRGHDAACAPCPSSAPALPPTRPSSADRVGPSVAPPASAAPTFHSTRRRGPHYPSA